MKIPMTCFQLLIIGFSLTWSSSSFAGDKLEASEIAAKAKSALVTIEAFNGEERVGTGSGFFISSDAKIATNLHVIENSTSLSVKLGSGELYENVFVLAHDERRDIAVLQIPLSNTPFLEIGDDRDAHVGSRIFVMGNPMGLEGTFSDGLISAKRIEDGVSYIQVTAPISEGSSGGPILDDRGRAIGITTMMLTQGQNLNLGVPARHASDMLLLPARPVPFETFAATKNWPADNEDLDRSEQSQIMLAALSEEAREEISSYSEYYQQSLVRQLLFAAVGAEMGWEPTDEIRSGTLANQKISSLKVDLTPGSYMALGTCDDDCIDLDIIVLDEDGNIVVTDVEEDAEPVAEFIVESRARFHIGTKMIQCETQDCFFITRLFRKDLGD